MRAQELHSDSCCCIISWPNIEAALPPIPVFTCKNTENKFDDSLKCLLENSPCKLEIAYELLFPARLLLELEPVASLTTSYCSKELTCKVNYGHDLFGVQTHVLRSLRAVQVFECFRICPCSLNMHRMKIPLR